MLGKSTRFVKLFYRYFLQVIISASLSWEVVLGRTITVIRIILLVLYLLFLVGNFALLYMSPAFTAVGTGKVRPQARLYEL